MRSPAELRPAETFQISRNKPPDCLTVSSANINYESRSVWQDNLQRWYTDTSIMHPGAKWNIKPEEGERTCSLCSRVGWVSLADVRSSICLTRACVQVGGVHDSKRRLTCRKPHGHLLLFQCPSQSSFSARWACIYYSISPLGGGGAEVKVTEEVCVTSVCTVVWMWVTVLQ